MRYLLVDAHSVIFAWPELRTLHTRRAVLARDELVKRLTTFQDAGDYRVIAVFDGKGSSNAGSTEEGGIQIFYSSAQHTADSIIERLVAKYAREHDMTVVTNDLLEQQTVITFGGLAVNVETFLRWYEEAERDLGRRLKQLRLKR